jgi:hypothetical protein
MLNEDYMNHGKEIVGELAEKWGVPYEKALNILKGNDLFLFFEWDLATRFLEQETSK